jgi:hypothetical protein
MADFLLDFRDAEQRRTAAAQAASAFQFCEAIRISSLVEERFTLTLASVDDPALWAPYTGNQTGGAEGVTVAVAGRVALDESDWLAAQSIPGPGGLACKILHQWHAEGGLASLASRLNGNCAVFVFDRPQARVSIITDRAGLLLVFVPDAFDRAPVFCSHPDVLATILGVSNDWDRDSMTEFLMTGRLSYPATYYRGIQGIETASIHTVDLQDKAPRRLPGSRYFEFKFKTAAGVTEDELAGKLAGAFRNAVVRRTLPRLGTTGLGMSGGLDSRAILAAVPSPERLQAFTLFDEENAEYRVARRLANAVGVRLIPIQREFEHYAGSAELGVRISGGTGAISSNHFLAVRGRLAELGIQNLVTGCHCDYLLKGLALNYRESRFRRQEEMAPFQFEFYRPIYPLTGAHVDAVHARFRATFPESAKKGPLSDAEWLAVEQRRSFPLAYEADLAQRIIPQRVMPWFPLMVDNDILETYLQIPSRMKLNASVFSRMLLLLADDRLCRIPNINTGAPVGATGPAFAFQRFLSALKNRLVTRVFPRMAIRGSWPNWEFYLQRSALIARQWERARERTRDLFNSLLGFDPYRRAPGDFQGREVELFIRIWTLKLWVEQRTAP